MDKLFRHGPADLFRHGSAGLFRRETAAASRHGSAVAFRRERNASSESGSAALFRAGGDESAPRGRASRRWRRPAWLIAVVLLSALIFHAAAAAGFVVTGWELPAGMLAVMVAVKLTAMAACSFHRRRRPAIPDPAGQPPS
ncbi:hypothetical protein [Nocardia sp. BMG111209]|uniref:hypothetical protein n=1 Tax=Nocardia sp. BMG111209 TaxID=1160137 RepID=UPI0003708DCD|nr:hypothetical protein [Nocardia sp. BMG111209]